jgi:sec-independent protein translocase protein TatA
LILFFGASRLSELVNGIVQALRNFKKATTEPDEIDTTSIKSTEKSSNTTKDKVED